MKKDNKKVSFKEYNKAKNKAILSIGKKKVIKKKITKKIKK